MVVDHVAAAFVPTSSALGQVMHAIGRLTAPIMMYFVAEGYHHTKDVRKYALRLGVFALISHFPYRFFQRRTMACICRRYPPAADLVHLPFVRRAYCPDCLEKR
ncbi:MAG: TraX family protein [Bacillota bacterium]